MTDGGRRTVVLALVLALVLGIGAGPGYVTTTATAGGPAANAVQPGPLPPGMNESGAADPVRLADAHAAILGNTSYAVNLTRVERFANGTLRTHIRTTGSHGPGDGFRYTRTVQESADRYYAGPAGAWEVWSNGTTTVAAFTNDSGTAYQLRGRTDPSLDHQEDLIVLLSALETAVTRRAASNATTAYRVEATGVRHPRDLARAFGVDEVRNVSFSAVVSPRGLVHEYRVALDAERAGVTTRVVEKVRFSALGETTVTRPAWLTEALARDDGTR